MMKRDGAMAREALGVAGSKRNILPPPRHPRVPCECDDPARIMGTQGPAVLHKGPEGMREAFSPSAIHERQASRIVSSA